MKPSLFVPKILHHPEEGKRIWNSQRVSKAHQETARAETSSLIMIDMIIKKFNGR
jgi:hypothetical protein